MFQVVESAHCGVDTNASVIDAWFAAATRDCADYENEQFLGSVTLEYHRRLCLCLDAYLQWLQQFLPEPLKERLQREQGDWLAHRKSRFATLNLLHGLLSGGSVPFDRAALLLAQANFVRQRLLDVEHLYHHFASAWRPQSPCALVSSD